MAAKNATIGALRVELGLDTAKFDQGLKSANGKLGGFAKAASAAGVAVGAAMAGAAVAMGVAVKGALDAADDMVKTAAKVGVAVDELSRLKHAADLSGVSMDGLSTALRKLSQNMMQTAEGGSSEAARAFQRLGLSVTDSSGQLKSADQVLSEVADRFAQMPDGVRKTADAVAIFGRAGTDLIPMLNGGAESLAAMKAEADALGIVIEEDTARAAEQFNDNLSRLQKVGEGLTTQLAAELAPALASVSDVLVQTAMDADLMRQVGGGLDRTIRGLVTGALALGAGLQFAGNSVRGMNEAVGLALQGRFGEAAKAFTGRAETAVSTIEQIRVQIDRLWANAGQSSAAGARAIVDRGFTPVVLGARQAAEAVKTAADSAADVLADLERDLDRIRDKVLSPEERRAKSIVEDVRKIQAAFAKGKIDAKEMHELIAGLDGGLKRMTLPVVEDLQALGSPEIRSDMDALRDRVAAVGEAFAQVGWAVRDIDYALRNNDWAGAAQSLITAIKGVQAAHAQGGAGLAIGTAAGAIAPMVGGVAGSTLSGMAGGAQLGMMFGGPIGAGIGAVVGGLAGFLGGSSSKNAQKDAEAQRRALEAYQKRMEQLARKRELELRLMELQGNAAGALAQRRADELAAMDAETRALQAQIYALEDKAELEARRANFDAAFLGAAEAIKPVMAEVAGELARLGFTGVSTRDQFKALVLGLDQTTEAGASTYKALIELAPKFLEVADYVDLVTAEANAQVAAAKADLVAAYEQEAGAMKAVIDRFRSFADTLRRFRDSLLSGSAAHLSPDAQYRVARMQFDQTRRAALAGDESAIGELPAVAQAYLDAARAVAPDAAAYARDLAAVRNAVQASEQLAAGEADAAEKQLAALETQVGQLVELNGGVRSVAEAIAALAQAQADAAATIAGAVAQATAVTSIPSAPADTTPKIWTPEGYANANPDVASWAPGAIGTRGYDGVLITSIDQALAYHWRHHGMVEGRGFATGGSFKVGGFGGPDSQFMPLWLTPGEMVDVRRPGQAWAADSGGLAGEVADLRRAIEQVAVNTRKAFSLLDEFDKTGLYVRGPAPDTAVPTEAAA